LYKYAEIINNSFKVNFSLFDVPIDFRMKIVLFKVLKIFMYLLSMIPFRALYFLSDILFYIIFYVIKYRRKVVEKNLFNAFPEKSISERYEIEKKFYVHFLDLIFESIKSMTISQKEIQKRFVFKNPEEITKYTDTGKSIIAVSGHYGNWEWGPLASANTFKSNVLVVYKPLTNKRFEKLLNLIRSRFGAIMVPMKLTLRKIVEYKSNPSIIVLVGDQTPPKEESHFFTRFLNQQTAIFLGVEKIAIKTNYPIFYFNITKIKRGHYECLLKLLVDKPKLTNEYEITHIHTQELEKIIRSKPEYWLWSHKRWKFTQKLNN
jgi:KDO2-lipid IV(A) lauroyltransferase